MLRICCVLLVMLATGVTAKAQPGPTCADEIAEAENQYLQGLFPEAISTLQGCLDREGTLLVEEAVQVHRLMGLAFMQMGELDQARLTVLNLLSIDPSYSADPVQDPPSYTALVDLVKRQVQVERPEDPAPDVVSEAELLGPEPTPEQPRRRWFQRPLDLVVVVGGAAVVATAAALVFGGGQPSP